MLFDKKYCIFAEKKICTYKITIDDSLLNQVRSAFTDEAEINSWMQTQLEILLLQIAEKMKPKKNNKESITENLRGIAKAPEDFDYKKELANRYEP